MGRPPADVPGSAGRLWPRLLWGGLCLLLLAGCGSSSFVGQRYANFTAYYNKFYNANQAFEEGMEAVRDTERPVDRSRYLSVFREPDGQTGQSEFENAIQKSADVLRKHPDSKWVDDALLLIGKSYFYQQNYVGAAQKFREVLALNTERGPETRFWLARTLVTNGSTAEAAEVIRGQEGEGAGSWAARMSLVRGDLLVRQEQWAEAETALERGLSGDVPEEAAARGAFLLGQVRETVGETEEARTAYRRVRGYDPPYELGFAARLSEIELQGQHGEASRALDRLRDLEQDDKNLENRGDIALVEARIYRALGRYDEARRTLRGVLYGEREERSLRGGERGRLHYDLATLYRDAFKDFSRAAAHFDTAGTSLSSQGPRAPTGARLPSAPSDPEAQATQYQNLAERAREVARMDSLLRLGRMDEPEFRAFVEELQQRRAARREARRDEEQEASRARRFRGRTEDPAARRRDTAPAAQTQSSDAGFLFFKDPARVQQGRRQFQQTWGERPRVDNWRRRTAMRSVQASAEDSAEGPEARPAEAAAAPAPREAGAGLDLSAVPRDSASQEAMAADRAVARYELANALFLAAGQPDSAATWYRRILQEDGDQPVARRALYALAEAYRAQGDTTAAQQAYGRLVEQYPDSPLARRARQRLGRAVETTDTNRPARADSAYAAAYDRWQSGAGRPALRGLLDVAREYPETRAAPRALLAAAVLYWQQMQADPLRAPTVPVWRYLWTASVDSAAADSSVGFRPPPLLREPARLAFPDSMGALPDTTALPVALADTGAIPTDAGLGAGGAGTAAPAADTTLGSSPPVPADSGAAADTLRARAPDSTAADSTRLLPPPDPHPPLKGLLSYLTDRYPEAPQVRRARSMLAMLEEERAPADSARPDTAATPEPPADTSALAAAEDTTTRRARPPADTLRRSDPSSRPSRPDDPPSSAEERAPLPAPGGASGAASERAWTLQVQAFSSSTDADRRVTALRRQLSDRWPVRVVVDPDLRGGPHVIVVGRFATQEAARTARSAVEEQLSRSLKIRRVPRSAGR